MPRTLQAFRRRRLSYISEGDRYLALCDILFDLLAPSTPVRRRAILRLEDNSAISDTTSLRNAANWLKQQKIPFSYHIIPHFRDPLGVYNTQAQWQDVPLGSPLATGFRTLLSDMQNAGGVPVMHGFTHQYYNSAYPELTRNPEDGASADDAEFYRITWDGSAFHYIGPLPEDQADHDASRALGAAWNINDSWAAKRIASGLAEIAGQALATPQVYTTPHYLGSAIASVAARRKFARVAERTLYFYGTFAWKAGGGVDYKNFDYTRVAGQYFPYLVNDVYGGNVLPDTLGSVEPEPYLGYPARTVADILADADRLKAVRDGVAAVSFHSYLPISNLKNLVNGLKSRGYTFVKATDL